MAGYLVDVVAESQGRNSRLLAVLGIIGLKGLLLIPHVFVLLFVSIAWSFVVWIGYWAVLFTGRLPDGFHAFIVGVQRWSVRVSLWYAGAVDGYPPFSLR